MGVNLVVIGKIIVIAPIRTIRDFFDFIIKNVLPFLGTLISSTPLNIFFIISVVLIFVMYIFSEPFIWTLMLLWEIERLFINIQILAMNLVIQLLYNWLSQIWNDLMDFVLFVIDEVWKEICGGAESFSEVSDCTGFDNFLIMIRIIVVSSYQSFIVLMFILQLIFAAFSDALCVDIECSNICSDPTCSSWAEKQTDFYTGEVIYNPGPFGINFETGPVKSYLSKVDVFYARILAKIIITALQFIINDALPWITQTFAFLMDVFKLLLLYFKWVAEWAVGAFAKILGKFSYIIIRAFYSVLNNPSTIIFNPNYYRTNITHYAEKNQNSIKSVFIDNYMADFTDLFLLWEDLPGNKNYTNTLIDLYFIIKNVLDITFQIPILMIQVSDKITCMLFNLPSCISLNFICLLFKPPLKCYTGAIYFDTGGGYFDFIQDFSFDAMWFVSHPLDLLGRRCTDYSTDKDWALENWGCDYQSLSVDCGGEVIISEKIKCVNPIFPGGVNLCPSGDYCSAAIHTPPETSCWDCLKNAYDLRPWGDYNDLWLLPSGFWVCGDVFNIIPGGFLFSSKSDTWDVITFVTGVFDIAGVAFWGDLGALGYVFWEQCNDLFKPLPGNCPCTICQADPSQLIYGLDFIPGLEGWTCNPYHPDPLLRCCSLSPWLSSLWIFDDIYEFFGADLFLDSSIVIFYP